jgi:predicted adenine nucleotide alpha hydrolase (AANH) superfamily ATPase
MKRGTVLCFILLGRVNNLKLLMHMCCAPCSTYPLEVLSAEGHDLEGLFFNPNIHPIEEFKRRRENVEKFAAIKGLKVHLEDDFRQELWESFKDGNEKRCMMCYATRLERAAVFASQNGYDAFTTSLLVSPYQKHDHIKEIGTRFAEKYKIPFYYIDFRPGFRQGQKMAKDMGLYRQKYCGCIISLNESGNKKK